MISAQKSWNWYLHHLKENGICKEVVSHASLLYVAEPAHVVHAYHPALFEPGWRVDRNSQVPQLQVRHFHPQLGQRRQVHPRTIPESRRYTKHQGEYVGLFFTLQNYCKERQGVKKEVRISTIYCSGITIPGNHFFPTYITTFFYGGM